MPPLSSRAAALLLTAAAAAGAPPSCSQRGYCPSNCTRAGATETDGLALLLADGALVASVGKAVALMRGFPGVTSDDALDVHTTFMYVCCVTDAEIRGAVLPALDSVVWDPVTVSYSHAVCNKDGSIILYADAATQAAMSALVARFEAAVAAQGVWIQPRASMENFHVTIGTTNASYPMDDALAAINAAIPEGAWAPPFAVTSFVFFLPVPHEVKSTGAAARAAR